MGELATDTGGGIGLDLAIILDKVFCVDTSILVEQVHGSSFGCGDTQANAGDGVEEECTIDRIEEWIKALTSEGADSESVRFGVGILENAAGLDDLIMRVTDEIGLVQDEDLAGAFGIDLFEHVLDMFYIRAGVRAGGIHDMQEKGSFGNFFESGAEGLYECGGKTTDKADGVAEKDLAPGGQDDVAHSGVEGGEHLCVRENRGVGETVEEATLTGVGVTDEGDSSEGHTLTLSTLDASATADSGEVVLDCLELGGDLAAIDFELGFTRAASTDAATETGEHDAFAGKARQEVIELCEFYLQLPFASAGTGSKEVEDELGAIKNFELKFPFEITLLGGRQFAVEENCVGGKSSGEGGDFNDLAFADEGCPIGMIANLNEVTGNGGTCTFSENRQFLEGILDRQFGQRIDRLFLPA